MGFLINSYRYSAGVSNGLLNNLVSYYKCDTSGSFPDAHGSNDGTINGATYTASGKINGAYDYDGINDFVSVADDNTLDITGDMTFNFWYRPDVLSINPVFMCKFATPIQAYNFYYDVSTQKLAYYSTAGQGAVQGDVIALSTGTTYMITYVRTGTTVKFYVNGTQYGSNTITSPQQSNAGAITIGTCASANYVNGLLDELAIYNGALDQTKIDSLYNSGAGLSYDSFTS